MHTVDGPSFILCLNILCIIFSLLKSRFECSRSKPPERTEILWLCIRRDNARNGAPPPSASPGHHPTPFSCPRKPNATEPVGWAASHGCSGLQKQTAWTLLAEPAHLSLSHSFLLCPELALLHVSNDDTASSFSHPLCPFSLHLPTPCPHLLFLTSVLLESQGLMQE